MGTDRGTFDQSDNLAFFQSDNLARGFRVGDLIIAGTFTTKGGGGMLRIARKDKLTGVISQLGGGIGSGIVNCLTRWGRYLAIGGSQAEGSGKERIQLWDGSAFSALAGGVTNGPAGYSVNAAVAYLGDLYIGGNFTEVDGVAMNNLAKWDADLEAWVDIGGADGPIYDMVVEGGTLYIVGAFSNIGGVAAKNKAFYTGGAFSVLGGSVGPAGVAQTNAIGFYNGAPIVTGNWTRIDGSTSTWDANYIAMLDAGDNKFHKMDTPSDGFETGSPAYGRRILQVGDRTFFTGAMTNAGNLSSVGRFAAWDGSFHKYGSGFGGNYGTSLYYWQKLLYVGGRQPSGTGGRLRTFDPDADTWAAADDSWGADIKCIGEY